MKIYLNAKSENELRNKIGMVLFAFEKAIGDKLRLFPEVGSQEISEGYLRELLDLACKASADTIDGKHYADLRQLCEMYRIYDVRNAVSHPNRGVHDNFWYRIAALSTEPAIQHLSLVQVREALAAAVEDRISPPPDHWFVKSNSTIANNLPKSTDYDVTGFVGRQSSLKELQSLLESPRNPALAIVGPGGTGKTALVLSLLGQLSKDHRTSEWCDAIIYTTAKQQELTADGTIELNTEASIEILSEQFRESAESLGYDNYFDQNVSEKESRKLVICVDNFETVLASDENAIRRLNEILPASCKLILTSRVPIDGVLTFSLKPLSDGEAANLAKKYSERSAGIKLSSQDILRLTSNVQNSPLAIKLAIDLYGKGFNMTIATGKAINELIAFSFTNLIDRLSDVEISVLEVLFIMNRNCSRGEVISILGMESEVTTAALVSLSKTSLVTRLQSSGIDLYSLSEAVRPLVRKNPRHLSVRKSMNNRIKAMAKEVIFHQNIQRDRQIGPEAQDYIDKTLPEHLKHLLIRAVRIIRGRKITLVGDWLAAAEELQAEHLKEANFFYFKGRILNLIGDYHLAKNALREAVKLSPDFIWARMELIETILEGVDSEAANEALELMEAEEFPTGLEPSSYAGRFLWILFYRALSMMDRWPQMLEVAKKGLAEPANSYGDIHLEFAALGSAYRVRNLHSSEPAVAYQGLLETSEFLLTLSSDYEVNDAQTKELFKVLKEIRHFFSENSDRPSLKFDELISTVALILDNMFEKGVLRNEFFDQAVRYVDAISIFSRSSECPLRKLAWIPSVNSDSECAPERITELRGLGVTVCRVSDITRVARGFVIAKRVGDSADVFIHVRKYALGEYPRWYSIEKNTLLAVELDTDSEGRYTAVNWTHLQDAQKIVI